MKTLNYYIMEKGKFTKHEKQAETTYEILKDALDDVTLALICVHPEIDIWYDDNFLLKGDFHPTLLIKNSDTPYMVQGSDILLQGKLMFASHDEEGETTDFPNEHIKWLNSKLQLAIMDGKLIHLFKNY